jgi:hypothetical protein
MISIIDVYEGGLVHNVFDIEEQHYLQISRETFGSGYVERYGDRRSRNYVYPFPGPSAPS